jgi:hypothetical protein
MMLNRIRKNIPNLGKQRSLEAINNVKRKIREDKEKLQERIKELTHK